MTIRFLYRFVPTSFPARSLRIRRALLVVTAAMSAGCVSAQAATVFGFTATSMVSFDSGAPEVFTTIGAHGIAADVAIFSPTFDPANGRVYAFGARPVQGGFDQSFLEFNLTTGAGTVVANLGINTTQAYEALAFHPGLGAMVASQSNLGLFNPTPRLGTISRLGVFSFLTNTSTNNDNDLATYDVGRGIFYSFDVQASPSRAFVVNPLTGIGSVAGGVLSTLIGVAWSSVDDAIYGIRSDSGQLVRVAQGTSFASVDIGTLSSPLTGIFTIPAPGTAAVLALGGLLAVRRRR